MKDAQYPDLPERLADLVRLIGWDGARKLTKAFGGVRLYVPTTFRDDHPIVQAIGIEAAQKLSSEFAGERGPVLPKSDAFMRRVRNADIRERRAKGESVRKLALEFDLTEVMIYNICEEGPPVPSPQMDLIGG